MNEKFNFHLSFGIFTPKLWYQTLFRTAPSTAAKDEDEEMESLEYECFHCWNETEEAFGDLVPLGIYVGDEGEDTESNIDSDGANLDDYGDEDANSNEEIEIDILGEGEDVDVEYTPVEVRDNGHNAEIEDQEMRIISFLNERINDLDVQDSFLSALDNSFSSS